MSVLWLSGQAGVLSHGVCVHFVISIFPPGIGIGANGGRLKGGPSGTCACVETDFCDDRLPCRGRLFPTVCGVGRNVGAFGLSCCFAAIPAATCAATWVASACGDRKAGGACGGDVGGGGVGGPAPRRRSEGRVFMVVGVLSLLPSVGNIVAV